MAVFTKISNIGRNIKKQEIVKLLKKSNQNLKKKKIEYLLFHDYKEFVKNNFKLPKKIIKYKNILFKKMGVSVYSPQEFLKCLEFKNIDCIQIPFNLVDYRWNDIDFNKLKLKNKRLEIHVRSVFLKGTLPRRTSYLPLWFTKNDKLNKKFIEIKNHYKMNLKKICFLFVFQQEWIDKIIIGFSKKSQILNIYTYTKDKKLLNFNNNTFNFLPKKILMPKYWN